MALQKTHKVSHKQRVNFVNFNLRISNDLKALFKSAAKAEDLKVSTWARRVLRREAERILSHPGANKAYSNCNAESNTESQLSGSGSEREAL
jgi:uncharacterized protein (DUF1778 family)